MKSLIKLISIIILCVLLFSFGFYMWAKMPNLSVTDYSYETKHTNNTIVKDSNIRILTYNLGYLSGMTNNLSVRGSKDLYDNNMSKLLSKLKHTKADLIAFQEIDFNSNRSYNINQSNYISDSLYSYSATSINWDKKYVPYPYWPLKANFGSMLSGQSVLSNMKLSNQERRVLQRVESNPFYYNAFYLDRLAQVVEVEHPVKAFYLINIHVEAFDKATRLVQLKHVLDIVKEKAKLLPVVLVGDFNSDPFYENAAVDIFLNDKDLACTAFEKNNLMKTYPSDKAFERLDYVFYTKKDFLCVDSRVLTEYEEISDHLPLFAVLKIK